MKSKLFVFTFFILHFTFYIQLFAQNTWIQTYDPFPGWQNPSYNVEDVLVCSDSGYAVNGTYNGFNGQEEFKWGFVVKTDSDGNMEWTKQDTIHNYLVHSSAMGMITTSDSCIISIGYSSNYGTYLIKRDMDGNKLWRKTMYDFVAFSLDNTIDENIILGGWQNYNVSLRKIDEDGNTIWTNSHNINNEHSKCQSIVQLSDGGYALTGWYDNEDTGFDVLVMKTDANGDSLWTRTHDAIGGSDEGNCVIESSNGSILVGGHITDPGQSAGFLWLLTESGETIWLQHVDLEIGASHFSVIPLNDNTFIAYCYKGFEGPVRQTSIYCFDTAYNIQWQSVFDCNVAYGDRCIKKINDGFIIGFRNFNTIYDNNTVLVKADEIGQYVGISNNLIQPINNSNLTCYPNPFNPLTTISYDLSQSSNIEISIYNVKGQVVKNLFSGFLDKGNHNIVWNGTDKSNNKASSGIYFVQLKANENLLTQKVLLLK